MDVKRCKKCNHTMPVEMFAGNGRQKDGLHHTCKLCVAAIYENRLKKARLRHNPNPSSPDEMRHEAKRIANPPPQPKRRHSTPREPMQFEFETPRTPEQLEREAEIRRMAREQRNKKALEYFHPKTPESRAKNREEKRQYRERTREIMQQKAQARNEAKLVSVSQEALRILEIHALNTPKIRKDSTPEEIREYRKYRYQLRKARILLNGGSHTQAEIRALLQAQNYQCAYCKRRAKLTEDHIIPLLQGGRDDIANICMACQRCNCQKSDRTPEQWVKRWYLQPSTLKTPRKRRKAAGF